MLILASNLLKEPSHIPVGRWKSDFILFLAKCVCLRLTMIAVVLHVYLEF